MTPREELLERVSDIIRVTQNPVDKPEYVAEAILFFIYMYGATVVPKEPTLEMLHAWRGDPTMPAPSLRESYQAMIAASPFAEKR